MSERPVALEEAGSLSVASAIAAMTWPLPVRSALLSPYQEPHTCSVLVVKHPQAARAATSDALHATL